MIQVDSNTPGLLYVLGLDPTQPVTLTDTSGSAGRVWSNASFPSDLSVGAGITNPTSTVATFPAQNRPGTTWTIRLHVTGADNVVRDLYVALVFPDTLGTSLPSPGFNLLGAAPQADGWAGQGATDVLTGAYLREHIGVTVALKPTGGDDAAMIQAAVDAYDEITLIGDFLVSTSIVVASPTTIRLRGTVAATSGCQEVLQVKNNLHIAGLHNFESVITPLAGYAAIKAIDPWPETVDGQASLHLERVGSEGGTSFLDMTGCATCVEANIYVRDCRAHLCTDYAVKTDQTYYGRFERNYWNLCKGGFKLEPNNETKLDSNVILLAKPVLHAAAATCTTTTSVTLAGLGASNIGDAIRIVGAGAGGIDYVGTILGVSGSTLTLDVATSTGVSGADAYIAGFAYLFRGVAHTDVYRDEVVNWLGWAEDARIMALNDAVDGITTFREVKFAAERRYWMRKYPAVRIYNPANPNYAPTAVKFFGNRFYGPVFFECTSIGGNGVHATATVVTPNSPLGHGLEVGDRFHLADCIDNRFNGQELVVTSVGAPGTSQTVSWASSVNVAQSNQSGFIGAAGLSALAVTSPFCGLTIEDNDFQNFNYGVDDTAIVTDGSNGLHGRGIYRGNTETGPNGMPFAAMKSGGGRGFAIVEPGVQALPVHVAAAPRQIETTRVQNRVVWSEDSSHWAVLGGITFTSGQADPFGGTGATLVTRAATSAIITAAPITFGEAVAVVVDNTGLPTSGTGYLKFWAKAGSLNSLWVTMSDSTTLLPGSQRTPKLDSTWRQYRIPFAYQNNGTIGLRFSPGAIGVLNQESGDLYIYGLQVSDVDCDYAPTTGTLVNDTTTGARFQRHVQVNGRLSAKGLLSSGTVPTAVDVTGIGSTGTYSFMTGSNDMAGTIKLNPGGSGIGAYVIFTVMFSAALPGNKPSITCTLEDGSSSWGTGASGVGLSTVSVYAVGNNTFNVIARNMRWDGAAVAGVTLASGSDQYRINYQVVCT